MISKVALVIKAEMFNIANKTKLCSGPASPKYWLYIDISIRGSLSKLIDTPPPHTYLPSNFDEICMYACFGC